MGLILGLMREIGGREEAWEERETLSKVKRGRGGVCSLAKALPILSMEGVMEGDTLIGYRTDR